MLTDVFRLSRPAVFSHFLFLIFLFFLAFRLGDLSTHPTSPDFSRNRHGFPIRSGQTEREPQPSTRRNQFDLFPSPFLIFSLCCEALQIFDYI
jgi:hypothetical protein